MAHPFSFVATDEPAFGDRIADLLTDAGYPTAVWHVGGGAFQIAMLGITHQEYAHVMHRRPVDRRIRDQIADKLGIRWSAIAEFMPEAALPWLEIASIPAPAGAPPPAEPWYLVQQTTGRIVSGPHDAPLPGKVRSLCVTR